MAHAAGALKVVGGVAAVLTGRQRDAREASPA